MLPKFGKLHLGNAIDTAMTSRRPGRIERDCSLALIHWRLLDGAGSMALT